MIEARTDVVGSLLRPPELEAARRRLERGAISPPEFKRIEDAAVNAAIRLQEDAGLAVVTDGARRPVSYRSCALRYLRSAGSPPPSSATRCPPPTSKPSCGRLR